jgi:hypothetical protein
MATTLGKVFDETVSFGRSGMTFDDKPRTTTWVARNKRWRVRVVQLYFKHLGTDQVCFAEFTKGGLLNYGPSPWIDEFGQPEDPYAWGSANVDRDNNRYGEIRDLIDLQDGINHRTSKFQHLISTRQTFRTETALGSQSPLEMRRQLARADGEVVLAPAWSLASSSASSRPGTWQTSSSSFCNSMRRVSLHRGRTLR